MSISVKYNDYTISNTVSKFQATEDEKSISFSCEFLILGTSVSNLESSCQAAELALTEMNKDLKVTFNGTTVYDFSHASNTGFNSRTSFVKIPNEACTATSRAYNFSCMISLPFTQSGYYMRREGSFNVSYTASRQRVVNFNVLYTASPNPPGLYNCLQNYQAVTGGAKWWAASILTTLGGTYELTSENHQEDMERKICTGSLQYKEILSNQYISGADYTSVVDPQLILNVEYSQDVGKSAAGFAAFPQVRVHVAYTCAINRDVVTVDNNIEEVYQKNVKPYIVGRSYALLGMSNYNQSGKNYIVEAENKTVDPYNYRVSGNITFLSLKTFDQILTLAEKVTTSIKSGIVFEKLWDELANTYNIWSTGGMKMITRTISIAKLKTPAHTPDPYGQSQQKAGFFDFGSVGDQFGATGSGSNSDSYLLLSREENTEVRELGAGTEITPTTGSVRVQSEIVYITTFFETYLVYFDAGSSNFTSVSI